jgi:lipopolysaccharide export system permease protein
MLLKKVFYRELVSNATKIFTVLVFILPLTELFKKLEEAASGSIPTSTLFALMLYGTIAGFPMILTIACFLSITLTINRYCKDQEFTIWLSSGISAFDWLRLTYFFAIPMTIICAICTIIITPWANLKSQEYINYLSKQQTTMAISPGLFKDNGENQVFYLDHYSITNGYAANIFVQYSSDNVTVYNIVAASGKIVNDDGLISLILKDGHRYELTNANENTLILGFGQFKASIKQAYTPLDKTTINIPTSSVQTLVSNGSNNAKAELSWRISVAIMMFVMSILVIPLSIQTGRVQSGIVFILPLIIYPIYENLILTFKGYLDNNNVYALLAIIILHVVLLLFALLLTYIKTLPKGYIFSKNKR